MNEPMIFALTAKLVEMHKKAGSKMYYRSHTHTSKSSFQISYRQLPWLCHIHVNHFTLVTHLANIHTIWRHLNKGSEDTSSIPNF